MSGTRRNLPRNGSGPRSSMSATSRPPRKLPPRSCCRVTVSSTPNAEADCPRNEIPPRPWDPPTSLQFPTKFKSQVVRINMVPAPVLAEVTSLNKSFQGLLKGTVWENYMLLTTQWPSDFASKTDPTGAPAPVYLANSTLETFSQGTIPLASSSCMACHGNAVS